ncbi:monocyte to macrophage differentiation factor 2 isoform X2 [Cylas formicarius]|nr:monocyte to macrophage differentiation factor 2 isoform X2 [Cylas formicarius]XP_060521555.1 monocyte to macrophage differentiation factor 2 isoform X2 [Cylas formicarius]
MVNSASLKDCFFYKDKTFRVSIQWMNQKALPTEQYQPAYIEHIANIITHGIWIFPSILGAVELFQRSQDRAQFVSAVIYGLTLILLFSVSTFFHCTFYLRHYSILKELLHRCDRAMIYIFIAGSYFPWLTIEQIPNNGWASSMKWFVWVMALMGITYQQIFHEKYKRLEMIFYLIMGIFPAIPIISEHYFAGWMEIFTGGTLYLIGTIFFKCDGVIPCAHAIWHLFVSMAAYCHYYAILNYLYPIINIRSDKLNY